MKEIITVNIGQPGIQIGNQTLSLYAAEHGLTKGGNQAEARDTGCIDEKYNQVLFSESQKGKWTYRSISVDCDQMTIDELKKSSNRQLYNDRNLISTKQETGGNYARGFLLAKQQLTETFQDKLRLMIENCDNFQGIFFNNSLLGGMAGFYTHMQSKIIGQNMFTKKPVINSMLFPSENMGNGVMETYNYILGFKGLLQFNNLTIVYDNQTIYKMCESQLGVDNPSYPEVNSLISQMMSSVTLSARSNGPLNSNLNELLTNMVCYPRIQLVYPSFTEFSGFDGYKGNYRSVLDITRNMFKPQSKMLKVYNVQNKIAVSLFYRGLTSPYQIRESLKRIKSQNDLNTRFEQWSPLGFKVGINSQPSFSFSQQQNRYKPLMNHKTCCSLTSSMEFNDILGHFNYKFDRVYAYRAFVHWLVGEGQDECQLTQCRQDLAALEKDYEVSNCILYQDQQENDVGQPE